VRAVIDWVRRLFDEHRDELAGTASQPAKAEPGAIAPPRLRLAISTESERQSENSLSGSTTSP
jgi:hypothetical protein